ncbi:MAG: glycosyltransferase family 2 protein [Alphaproteobacteria bacterium]|nr:glycosyltransferase family 2 protein [Alphaproteobacteria bacterium]
MSKAKAPPPEPRIAVVIPCYCVTRHIAGVIAAVPDMVWRIYVVDDKCPDGSGAFVEDTVRDPRVRVLYHDANQGVGGTTLTGMRQAIADGADVIVKIDGDGQMDPALLPAFVSPILAGQADCAKGNRFFEIDSLRAMPKIRLIGNAGLSFMAKLSTGYWHIFDPNNGYIALHAKVAALLPFDKIAKGYFFESDLLFRLNTIQAVVTEVPMAAVYGDEVSNLNVGRETLTFAAGHARNFFKRLFYNYYLRNFSVASLEIVVAAVGLAFGVGYGGVMWRQSIVSGGAAASGVVMLAALPVIVGMQSLFAFLNHDINSVPSTPLHTRLQNWPGTPPKKDER